MADTPAPAPPALALTIASSDSGGGAGIQADLKAFARCGVHGMSAIVALTAQNTTGVTAIHECPPAFVTAQIEAVLSDLPPAAIKTGMLFSEPIIAAVAAALADICGNPGGTPLVVDPVMLASSGSKLLKDNAIGALVELIFPLATVITPNLMEAQALTGLNTEDRAEIAEALVAMGARGALVTGGHGREAIDHLFDGKRHVELPVVRHVVAATHGAGCTHSAALAAGLARGDRLEVAARRAAAVAGDAVLHGLVGIGAGDGPVDALNVRSMFPR
ncbi:MAG: hydroxymethylpyrimidine/phosphomethylpyrimidine kinase [Pseudonocardiales bacterium]|nr:hydroxymethylpyrimidine/phosphomethylpyrimidine kinase [Pseudonocardiales bacterium]